MNNDKERLKIFVNGWHHGWPIDCKKSEEDEALKTVLDLIDRQPTEDEALDMIHDIEWFMSNCAHHTGQCDKCEDCFNFSNCELKIGAFRKLPPFRCSGQEIERVEIENIDERSVTRGNIVDINLYELTEGWAGEIEEAMGGVE